MQRFFTEAYAGHPFVHVPAVIDEYCTQRVFTSELAEGVRLLNAILDVYLNKDITLA